MHVKDFQLFLFDMDGLLIDTEPLHFEAYKTLCRRKGCSLDIDFISYCSIAHQGPAELQDFLISQFPELKKTPWDILRKEKRDILFDLLQKWDLQSMPGVEEFLSFLQKKNMTRCVVTNSSLRDVKIIQKKLPVLQTIPYWITREDYTHEKPHPESYQKAIALYGEGKRIIGFEDSIRGFVALSQTSAVPVLICSAKMPYSEGIAQHFESLEDYFVQYGESDRER